MTSGNPDSNFGLAARPPQVLVVADKVAIFAAAAEEWAARVQAAVAARGRFTVVLAGGSTPKGLYELLAGPAGANLPWDKTYVFFGDERHVPPDHADSNYHMANDALLSHVPIPAENIFRILAEENDAHRAADQYEETLRQFFRCGGDRSAGYGAESGYLFPCFDLILLGMGPDGHTASLFPGTEGLLENSRWVIANWVEKFSTWRITFTWPVLNEAACVLFMAAGADKAAMLHTVLDTANDDDAPMEQFPSRYVRPNRRMRAGSVACRNEPGDLIWLVDNAAAAQLRDRK